MVAVRFWPIRRPLTLLTAKLWSREYVCASSRTLFMPTGLLSSLQTLQPRRTALRCSITETLRCVDGRLVSDEHFLNHLSISWTRWTSCLHFTASSIEEWHSILIRTTFLCSFLRLELYMLRWRRERRSSTSQCFQVPPNVIRRQRTYLKIWKWIQFAWYRIHQSTMIDIYYKEQRCIDDMNVIAFPRTKDIFVRNEIINRVD
jgi:hypothetical protein